MKTTCFHEGNKPAAKEKKKESGVQQEMQKRRGQIICFLRRKRKGNVRAYRKGCLPGEGGKTPKHSEQNKRPILARVEKNTSFAREGGRRTGHHSSHLERDVAGSRGMIRQAKQTEAHQGAMGKVVIM